MHVIRKVEMNKHSFPTTRNITFTNSYCPHPGIRVDRMNHSELYPPHSSMAVTTERSQVHALQSKHDPSVGGNSRCLGVWVCQTQKPRLMEPSSCPPTHLPKGDQHQSVGGTEMTQSPWSLIAAVVFGS